MEVETYKKELGTKNMVTYGEKSEEILSKHEKEIIDYANTFIPDKLTKIIEMNLDIGDRIAYIERELEIYAYNNFKIDELNHELEELDNVPKDLDNKKELLKRVSDLEKKYIVLNDYGMHELDLKPLYEIKFDILSIDMVNESNNPFINVHNERELNYYKDIIARKIEINITGVDSILSNVLRSEDRDIISKITSLLKDDGYFDYKSILEDRFLVALVLSMESIEKAENLFYNYILSEDDFRLKDLYYDCFAYNRISFGKSIAGIPLGTLCNVFKINIRSSNYLKCVTDIYDCFIKDKYHSDYIFKIPEGIKLINLNWLSLNNCYA